MYVNNFIDWYSAKKNGMTDMYTNIKIPSKIKPSVPPIASCPNASFAIFGNTTIHKARAGILIPIMIIFKNKVDTCFIKKAPHFIHVDIDYRLIFIVLQ